MFLTPTPPDLSFAQVAERVNRDIAMRATLTPAGRFNLLIDRAMKNVADVIVWGRIPIPVIRLVWRRLRNLRARYNTILARFQAGTLPAPNTAPPQPAAASPPPEAPPSDAPTPKAPPPPRLPQHSGWLLDTISWFVTLRRHELEEMLDDPQTKAEVTEAPQLGSALRPACTMLAVKQPPWLRLPRRPRTRPSRAKVIPPAPDFLLNAPGAIIKPDGTIWKRIGASSTWRPSYGGTLEEAQKIDKPVRIWPR